MTNRTSFFSRHKAWTGIFMLAGVFLVILYVWGELTGNSEPGFGESESGGQNVFKDTDILIIHKQPVSNALSWQGTVRSRLAVKIVPKLTARLVEVAVHPGDRLKKGQLIARLDDRDLRDAYNVANADLIAAQAQATQARTEQSRISDLYHKQAATRQNFDLVIAESQLAQANASQIAISAQQSKDMLGENFLYAPFDGLVGERLQESGDIATPAQAVVTFINPDDLRLEVGIAEQCAAAVKLGMEVPVRIDAIQQTVSGRIDEIAPEINLESHTELIKISLPKTTGLQHGQSGWLALACEADQQTLLVPAAAVLHFGNVQAVKVIESRQTHIRHIRTGKAYGDQLEVLSGLQEGESIVVEKGSHL